MLTPCVPPHVMTQNAGLGRLASSLLLLLALVCSSQNAQAQPSTQAACYTSYTTYHWDPVLGQCSSGAPSSCEQFYTDSTHCTSGSWNGVCAVNTQNGQCYAIPQAAPLSTTCNAQTNLTGCKNAGCYFDQYDPASGGNGKCRQSLAEVLQLYPNCIDWSNYPYNVASDVCSDARGCVLLTSSGICVSPTYTTNNVSSANRVSFNFTYTTVNPRMTNVDTFTFGVSLQFPLSQFFNPSQPVLTAVAIGPQTFNTTYPVQPSFCNSVLTAQPAIGIGQPAVYPPYSDTTGMRTDFLASSNLNFSSVSTAAEKLALYQTVGYANVGPSSILNSVTQPANTVSFNLGGDLRVLAAKCGVVMTSPSSTQTTFDIPIKVNFRVGDSQIQVSQRIYQNIFSYGQISTGVSTNALSTVSFTVQDVYGGVPGTMRRTFAVSLTYQTASPTQVIGLRNTSDISMVKTRGGSQVVGSPTNCFQTQPTSVTYPSGTPTLCSSTSAYYCWTTIAYFTTDVVVSQPDSNSLNLCKYQPTAVSDALMGTGVSFPTSLDYQQNFYVFPMQWTYGNPTGPATAVGADVTGATGDYIPLSINTPTTQSAQSQNATLTPPKCGFLTDKTSTSTSDVVFGTTNSSGTFLDLRNVDLANDYLLIVACFLDDALQPLYTLQIQDSLSVLPLDNAGALITDSLGNPQATLAFTSLLPYLSYTTRIHSGAHLPFNSVAPGRDTFGVAPSLLRGFIASYGYDFIIPTITVVPTLTTSTSGTSRRLLEAEGERNVVQIGAVRRLLQVSNSSSSSNNSAAVTASETSNSDNTQTNSSVGVVFGNITTIVVVPGYSTVSDNSNATTAVFAGTMVALVAGIAVVVAVATPTTAAVVGVATLGTVAATTTTAGSSSAIAAAVPSVVSGRWTWFSWKKKDQASTDHEKAAIAASKSATVSGRARSQSRTRGSRVVSSSSSDSSSSPSDSESDALSLTDEY